MVDEGIDFRRGETGNYSGINYEETKGLEPAEITKLIRSEIRALMKSGKLPKAKYSIRKDQYAHGWSMYICATELPFVVSRKKNRGFENSKESGELIERLEQIANQYNYDHGNVLVDYHRERFILFVRLEDTIGNWAQ